MILVQALKNWRYVQEAVHSWERDPFVISTEDTAGVDILLKVLNDANDSSVNGEKTSALKKTVRKILDEGKVPEQNMKLLFDISRKEKHETEKFRAFLNRLMMAIIGGAFLICPVTIMAYNQALWITLLTTSLSVIALGIVLAKWIDNEFNVLAGAAAYTAVLVVFVGLSAEKS